jgi:orotate phosphoribosyltransferase
MNSESQIAVAENLLKINAVKLSPENPFTWASGIKSPIYCDNRKILSFPDTRNFIKIEFANLIKEKYPETDVIAGVATGAIAIGALVADVLNLPFVYIRSEQKKHGLGNKIEGILKPEQNVIIIEDLVSTGMSSLAAFESVKENGNTILGMLAIFTYNLPVSVSNFNNAGCQLTTLTDFDILTKNALEKKSISYADFEILMKWKSEFSSK